MLSCAGAPHVLSPFVRDMEPMGENLFCICLWYSASAAPGQLSSTSECPSVQKPSYRYVRVRKRWWQCCPCGDRSGQCGLPRDRR